MSLNNPTPAEPSGASWKRLWPFACDVGLLLAHIAAGQLPSG
jgi:hypothetical protein